jgi:thiol-disulfide isomerase/thioredoxin
MWSVFLMRFLFLCLYFFTYSLSAAKPLYPVLEIGAQAPDFKLKGIDDKIHSLSEYKKDILALIFTCNHCPTSQAYEDRIMKMVNDYKEKSLDVVVISSADPQAVRLNELAYTVHDDSFEGMKLRAAEKKYNHPYLYDGDEQIASRAYGPVATPHIFIFDAARKLRYQGRIDNNERQQGEVVLDAQNAIDELLAGKDVTVKTTRVFGCSTKWSVKRDAVKKYNEEWEAREVTLEDIDEAGLKKIIANKTEKLRFVNIWATWCGPCVSEFPEIVSLNRQFETRSFEVISLSADFMNNKARALKFLKSENAAITKRIEKSVKAEGRTTNNYIINISNRDKMMDAIDKQWQGPLPYSLLIAPGGKVLWRHTGEIDFIELKRVIVGYLGNVYK